MKKFLTVLVFLLFASASAASIQVVLQMPAGLQVGKNKILAQVQTDSSIPTGTPVSLAIDPGNNQPIQEVVLGKVGDSNFGGEVELTSLNPNPSLTVKVTKPDARYASSQVVPQTATSAQFSLEAPRSRNANHGLIVLLCMVVFAVLGSMALRGEQSAF